MEVDKLPYYIKQVTELSDRLYEKVSMHLSESISYVSREEYREKGLCDSIDLQGELAGTIFELRRISWGLTQMKRVIEGNKPSVVAMMRRIDEYRHEINQLADSLRVNMFVMRDRINYLNTKVDY